jgi:hypothetical protein
MDYNNCSKFLNSTIIYDYYGFGGHPNENLIQNKIERINIEGKPSNN